MARKQQVANSATPARTWDRQEMESTLQPHQDQGLGAPVPGENSGGSCTVTQPGTMAAGPPPRAAMKLRQHRAPVQDVPHPGPAGSLVQFLVSRGDRSPGHSRFGRKSAADLPISNQQSRPAGWPLRGYSSTGLDSRSSQTTSEINGSPAVAGAYGGCVWS